MSDLIKVQQGGNFYIQELASPWWFAQASSPEHVLQGLRLNAPAMIEGTQLVRDIAGESVTLNNWHRGGSYSESVLRTPHTLGAQRFSIFSSHMFWGGADHKFKSLDISEMYRIILEDSKKFDMVLAMEDINYTRSRRGKLGKDWLHIQYGYRRHSDKIRIFKP